MTNNAYKKSGQIAVDFLRVLVTRSVGSLTVQYLTRRGVVVSGVLRI